jgi:hypothetical protein
MTPLQTWRLLFFLLLAAYCGYYAPYGVNETDGGFLTGLAWQVLQGKTLYADVVYVRPPLPVWLRALELYSLPAEYAVLGERWIFYLKVGAYAWLGAAVLAQGVRRWQLAALAFVLSAHCYPAAAWHTVDGILFGALSIWAFTNTGGRGGAIVSGLCLVAALLCKQSFYPLAVVWLVLLLAERRQWAGAGGRWWALFGALAATAAFAIALQDRQALAAFLRLTSAAAEGNQALAHGFTDYFRIPPLLLGASAVLLAPAVWWLAGKGGPKRAFLGWALWLLALASAYAWTVLQRAEFTAPFAHTRLLFVAAAAWAGVQYWKKHWSAAQSRRFGALLALCWCAALSWGYNLPVLFALPWAYAAWDISTSLFQAAWPGRSTPALPALALILLLGLFRLGYAYVYRDGPRSAMTEAMGPIFPALMGIRSSPEKAALYRDLCDLARRYGPAFKTLPAFPQANFLAGARPPLPLDWVVARETGAGTALVEAAMRQDNVVYFIEKAHAGRLETDPEMALTRALLARGRVVEETRFFRVVRGSGTGF